VAFYLDASVIVPLLVAETASGAVSRFVSEVDEPLLVSEFAAAEVASALSRLVRTGELSADGARLALVDFDTWRPAETLPIEIDDLDIADAGRLVRRFELKLRTPDALHLAVCVRAGATLVTLDHGLAEAAQACGALAVSP